MRLNHVLGISVLFVGLSIPAIADHQTGSLHDLVKAARNLNSLVANSSLRFAVRNAVSFFVNDVELVHRCADTAGQVSDSETNSDVTDDHTGTLPQVCRPALDRARSSFYPVERYLHDTNWDYPSVYQAYLSARAILSSL